MELSLSAPPGWQSLGKATSLLQCYLTLLQLSALILPATKLRGLLTAAIAFCCCFLVFATGLWSGVAGSQWAVPPLAARQSSSPKPE